MRFVLARDDSLGTQDGEMEQGRTTLDPLLARNPNIKVSAKVASNHSKILRNDSPAVAHAVRETAAVPMIRRSAAPLTRDAAGARDAALERYG